MNICPFVEPETVYPESEFEKEIIRLVSAELSHMPGSIIIPRLGLDIAIFLREANVARALFIEVKAYGAQRMGGVGFGTSIGKGSQVDILLQSEEKLSLLDQFIRWAIVDATSPPGSERYGLINCTQARHAAMGGVAQGKQNNFRLGTIRHSLKPWVAFCGEISKFLSIACEDRDYL